VGFVLVTWGKINLTVKYSIGPKMWRVGIVTLCIKYACLRHTMAATFCCFCYCAKPSQCQSHSLRDGDMPFIDRRWHHLCRSI
jgi:hypothetical protein